MALAEHGHLRLRDAVPDRPAEARRRRPELEPRFRPRHHPAPGEARESASPTASRAPASARPRRRRSIGATSARSTPIGRPTSTSPTRCRRSTSTTGAGRSGPMARSRRRRSSSSTMRAAAAWRSTRSSRAAASFPARRSAARCSSPACTSTPIRKIEDAVIMPYVEIGRGARLSKVVVDRGRQHPARACRRRGSRPRRAALSPQRARHLPDHPAHDRPARQLRSGGRTHAGPFGRLGNLSAYQDRRPRRRRRRAAGGAWRERASRCATLVPGYPRCPGKARRTRRLVHQLRRSLRRTGPAPRRGTAAGLDLLVLDAPHLYARAGNPYVDRTGRDWPDNAQRFAALARVAADIGLGLLDALSARTSSTRTTGRPDSRPPISTTARAPRPGDRDHRSQPRLPGALPRRAAAEPDAPASRRSPSTAWNISAASAS